MKLRHRMLPFLSCACLFLTVASQLFAQTDTRTELTVFAASSLTEAFQSLGRKFEASHRGVSVKFNFAGSQQLVQQIVQGAKADLFAPADMKQMTVAVTSSVIDTAHIGIFARNRLVVIVPKENRARLEQLKDLAKPDIKIVLADSSVPVGRYATEALRRCSESPAFGASFRKDVLGNVVSYEENVRAVLSKVKLDECDAGIVYSSEIAHDSLGEVRRIDIPDQFNVIAEYPMAIVRESKSPRLAKEFLDYVLSAEGAGVLSASGFMVSGRTGIW